MSQVFVSGHKSPDTDSIAAALSYSYLKRRLGMDAVAVRAGEINKESRFALDYFNLEEPMLVTSVARKNPEDEKQKVILVDHNESWKLLTIIVSGISNRRIRFSFLFVLSVV